MKRVITLLLAAGLVLGAATASQATDVKVKGNYQFGFEGTSNSFTDPDPNDRFQASQRFRTQIDFIASENLKGVVFFEIGKTVWGNGDSGTVNGGGAIGTDGVNVKTRYAYVDWVIPQTDVQVRMGLQPYALPAFVAASPILGNPVDGAGITVSAQFTENVGASLFWMRATNQDNADINNDILDLVGLTVPVTFDGVKVTPWAMGAFAGKNSLDIANNSDQKRVASGLLPAWGYNRLENSEDDGGNAWWLGFTGELSMFDPIRIAWDAAYGSADMGNIGSMDLERSGWYIAALAQYKMDFVTPGLLLFYASGDDDDVMDGSEQIPTIDAGWNASSFGFDGSVYGASSNVKISDTIAGMWGVQLRFDDISYMEDLKHDLRFAYYTGTNDEEVVKQLGGAVFGNGIDGVGRAGSQGLYLTDKDHAFEVNFDTDYNIYENLILTVELGYINLDLDSDVWNKTNVEENAYKAGAYLTYNF